MKNTRAIIVKILLSGLILGPFAAFAEDVVLQIGLVDQLAITTNETATSDAILRRQWPNARVETVNVGTARMGNVFGDGRVRRRLIAKLRALKLAPEDRIQLLLLNTHGSSSVAKDVTRLSIIGEVTSKGVDAKFSEIFEPIKVNMAPDAQVVLHSCSTMCGTDLEAARRARSLLTALGAPDGSLYGAHTPHAPTSVSLRPTYKETFLYVMSTIGIVEMMMVASVVVDPEFPATMADKTAALLWLAKHTAIYGGMVYAMGKIGVPMVYANASRKLKVNYGRLFRFNGGRTEEVREISYAFNREELLSPRKACAIVLGQAAGL